MSIIKHLFSWLSDPRGNSALGDRYLNEVAYHKAEALNEYLQSWDVHADKKISFIEEQNTLQLTKLFGYFTMCPIEVLW